MNPSITLNGIVGVRGGEKVFCNDICLERYVKDSLEKYREMVEKFKKEGNS